MTTTTAPPPPLTDLLVRLGHRVQHAFADAGRDHDLTPQQAQLLCIVHRGPVGMTELSRVLHLEKSSLTGLVDRVERRGLAARTRDGDDRRACRIMLTPEGERLALAAHAAVTRRLERLAAALPPAERAHLASLLTGLLAG